MRVSSLTCSRSSAKSVRQEPTLWVRVWHLMSGTASQLDLSLRGWWWMREKPLLTALSKNQLSQKPIVCLSGLLKLPLLTLCFCSSTWTPKGDYAASNTDECTATLSYAVSLKKPGTVTFEYFHPDRNLYFEFFVSAAVASMCLAYFGKIW